MKQIKLITSTVEHSIDTTQLLKALKEELRKEKTEYGSTIKENDN